MKKWEQEGIIVKSRTSFSDALYLEKLKSSKWGISQKEVERAAFTMIMKKKHLNKNTSKCDSVTPFVIVLA